MKSLSLTRTLVATLVATTLTASALALAAPPTESAAGVSPAQLGMFVGFDRGDRFADMERRLDQPIKWVVTMAGKRSPSDMTGSAWGQLAKAGAFLPSVDERVNLVMSVPVGFGDGGLYRQVDGRNKVRRTLTDVASGVHDEAYRKVARHLIDAGYGDAVLRLGHEFDGTYEPYSARENNDAYIAAYRHVHDLFARESSAFRFEWTSMRAHYLDHGPPAYPGDAYVDIVGLDIYYRQGTEITDQVWTSQYLSVLTAHRDFAISHGKPVAYSEWGRANYDTSRYVDLMHAWFSSMGTQGPGSLLYQSYFNSVGVYDLAGLPVVRERYLTMFGRNDAVTPPTTTPPTTTLPTTATTPPTTITTTTPPPTTLPTTTTTPPPTTPPITTPPTTTPPATPLPTTPPGAGPPVPGGSGVVNVSEQVLSASKITVTRPPGALVLTQRCGVFNALPAVDAVDDFPGFPFDLPAAGAAADQIGIAPVGDPADDPDLGIIPDPEFANYPLPEPPTYPTACGVAMGTAQLVTEGNLEGEFFAAHGRMNEVTVVDIRDNDAGWTVRGDVEDRFSGLTGDSFSGDYLGWQPIVTNDSSIVGGESPDASGALYDQTVIAGPPILPGTGFSTPAAGLTDEPLLARALAGRGLGIATLDARLTLLIPAWVDAGDYSATITITAS